MTRTAPFLLCATLAGLAGAALSAPAAWSTPARSIPGQSASPQLEGSAKAGVDAWSAGDYERAVRLWKPLADRGDPDAQFNLAQAYKLGRGVPTDLAMAEAFYGKAAASGHVQASDSYGLLLFQRGERQRALPYIQASAARGDSRAQYILGIAHFNGDIVTKDWLRAYALLSLARQAGLPQATRAMTQMDSYIPLADRQKSVLLAQRMAAEAKATYDHQTASADFGMPAGPSSPASAASRSGGPVRLGIEPVENGARHPEQLALSSSPATAGADYSRSAAPSSQTRQADKPHSRPAATPAPPPALKPASTLTKAERKPDAKPAPKPVVKAASPLAAKSAPTSAPWRVQLGAFGIAGNAEALWSKVRKRPELAGHPRALIPAGRLTKLQATGFASSAQAQAACTKLVAAGFACAVARD